MALSLARSPHVRSLAVLFGFNFCFYKGPSCCQASSLPPIPFCPAYFIYTSFPQIQGHVCSNSLLVSYGEEG